MNIDNNQLKAIRHKDGPALILAGPGSGKTTVITRRIQHLIEEYHIRPEHILVITFSRAAAKEMKDRYYNLSHRKNLPVTFGTFHAVFFQILKHAYGYTANQIVHEEQRTQFVHEYIHRLRLEYDDENDFIRSVLSEISLVKNSSVDLNHYYSASCAETVFRKIYLAYQEYLNQNKYLDFDDMLVYTKELFEQRHDILLTWQNKFRYILIDEFQDINLIQYQIIQLLSQPRNNLFVVGDDDQSIYGFRGSKPEIMLGFERDYPNTVKILLSVNYRCSKEIVKYSGNLISHNHTRFPKDIIANKQSGLPVYMQGFPCQREQNLFVIHQIQKLHREAGIPYSNFAVLFRTNMQPSLLIQQFMENNIPFFSREHIPNIFNHWIATDLFTYLRLAQGDRSRSAFLKIMNRPTRYLSRESLPYENVSFALWKNYYRNQNWMIQRLEKLESDLNVIQGMRPYSAINYIRKAVAYEDYLKSFSEQRKIPFDELTDLLDEIQEDAKPFESFQTWFDHIEMLSKEWAEKFLQYGARTESVILSTLHSAKGLEFDTVFILDVNEKLIPHKKAVLEYEIEEERRMFYVGMTRAINRLYLLHSQQIRNKSADPSRFLKECISGKP